MTKEEMPYFSKPGDMIQYLRKKQNITIIELAHKMGVSQAYIVRIEQGQCKPIEEQLEVLCSFIDE